MAVKGPLERLEGSPTVRRDFPAGLTDAGNTIPLRLAEGGSVWLLVVAAGGCPIVLPIMDHGAGRALAAELESRRGGYIMKDV